MIRRFDLDFIKVIGLIAITLVHVPVPNYVIAACSFNVVLLVLVSGMFAEACYKKSGGGWKYISKRFERLAVPTWIFLIVYFGVRALQGDFFTIREYVNSFLFTQYGIGYVWIVLVYLYCAVAVPFAIKLKGNHLTRIAIILIYLIYEVACYFELGLNNRIVESTIYYFIPYGILTIIAINYKNISKKYKYIICFLSYIGSIIGALLSKIEYGRIRVPGVYKYPPRFYWLAISIALSFTILLVFEGRDYALYKNRIVTFVSRHSYWIYLWHIMILYVFTTVFPINVCPLQYISVILSAIGVTYLQNCIVDRIERKRSIGFLKYFRG